MTMTVERLYTRQVPKSVTGSELMFKKSAKPMTGEDVLGILGQIQHAHPVGARILDAKISQDQTARAKLVGALTAKLVSMGKAVELASAMAECAVYEVCDTHICDKCHGTGSVYSRKYSKVFECSRCNGVGRVIPTDATLLKRINAELGAPIDKAEWQKRHYDHYMDAVDTLHRNERQAAQYARHLLDMADQ